MGLGEVKGDDRGGEIFRRFCLREGAAPDPAEVEIFPARNVSVLGVIRHC